jgi:hypothetical protein
MIYLSGAVYPAILRWRHGGIMLTPEMGNAPDLEGVCWAADNGCYTAGNRFSEAKWIRFLKKWQGQGTCFFAVAPDVPFDMDATWERSRSYLPVIRNLGYPAALAIQNGVISSRLPWDAFDAIFIAGDKRFKTSRLAREVCEQAKVRGKHIHIARRNSAKSLQEAQGMWADTCDGTFLKYGPDKNWPRLQDWFMRLQPHTQMELW